MTYSEAQKKKYENPEFAAKIVFTQIKNKHPWRQNYPCTKPS